MATGLNIRSAFELDRPLGESRVAASYRGAESKSGAKVAVKVIRTSGMPEAAERVAEALELLERLQEAQIPGLARIYDTGTTDTGDIYISTEWRDGRPLVELGRQRPAEVLFYALQAALILRTLTDRKLAHLNVRPDNFFLREDGQLELTGLGTGYLFPPGGMTESDHYWAPELDLPPRGFRNEFWKSDLFALALSTLNLLNAQVTGAGSRVPHIRLPDGLESAIDSGPELCLALEESLHESEDRRPRSFGVLIDCFERGLAQTQTPVAPSRKSSSEEGEGAMQSLRDMWTEGLSDVDLRSGARALDARTTQSIPIIQEEELSNIVLSEDEGVVIAADQDLTTEIRLPSLTDETYLERRSPRTHSAKLDLAATDSPSTETLDREIEEALAALSDHGNTAPEPSASPAPPVSQESVTGSFAIQEAPPPEPREEPLPSPKPARLFPPEAAGASRSPAIDWTRPGYAAKRSDPWESVRHLPWRQVAAAAILILFLGSVALVWRSLERTPNAAPNVGTPLEIDTSQVASLPAESAATQSDSQSSSEPSPTQTGSASDADQSTGGTTATPPAEDSPLTGTATGPPRTSSPLESLVADLPDQVVPTTRVSPDLGTDSGPTVTARAVPDRRPRVRPGRDTSSNQTPSSSGTRANTRPTPRPTPPRAAPPQVSTARGSGTGTSASADAGSGRDLPTRSAPSPPSTMVTAEQARRTALSRLDRALRSGDADLLRVTLGQLDSADRAQIDRTTDGRRVLAFAEVAANSLSQAEGQLAENKWAEALRSATRLETQFPTLASSSLLKERAAVGLERFADQTADAGNYLDADTALRQLRRLWPEREGISDKLRRLASQRQEQRNLELLAEIAAAERSERPHEALQVLADLEGQIPTEEFEAREAELVDQLTRLDAGAPVIGLDPFEDTTFVKGQPLTLKLQIDDDYEVAGVELRLRQAGSDTFLTLPIELLGGRVYQAQIPSSVHLDRKIGIWVRAFDRSGNVGELGSERRPRRLKPRRARR